MGGGQIRSAMTQLTQTTQQNASASEELAATAEEMSSQAEQLQQLIGFFKVDSQPAPGSMQVVRTRSKSKVATTAKGASLPLAEEAGFVRF